MTKSGKPAAKPKPTLRTIAQISGLAVTTVSRALGDAPDISQATKQRVQKIAQEIGYVPNRAGVRLRTGRTNVISIVLGTEGDGLNMTTQLISAVAAGLRGTPYHLTMTPAFPDEDPLKPIRYLVESRSADAVILNQTMIDDPRVAYLREQRFAFVTYGRTQWAADHAWVDYDNHAFGALGVERLAQRNRKRLVLLAPPPDQFYAREIIEGARQSALRCGVDLAVAQPVTSDHSREDILSWVGKQIGGAHQGDGYLVASPNAALAVVAGFERHGMQLGQSFDVFAKETVSILSLLRPEILGVTEDVTRAGHDLARAAIAATRNSPDHPVQILTAPR